MSLFFAEGHRHKHYTPCYRKGLFVVRRYRYFVSHFSHPSAQSVTPVTLIFLLALTSYLTTTCDCLAPLHMAANSGRQATRNPRFYLKKAVM